MIFHHVGIVTPLIDQTISFYLSIGYKKILMVNDDCQLASLTLLEKTGGPLIELIFPLSKEGPAYAWLDRITVGPYHTCYECSNFEQQIEALKEQGLIVVSEINTAIAFDHRRIVFMWGKQTGLLELLESPVRCDHEI